MKESVTKFDLEAAFKALDEIELPKATKVKANRPALTEIFSRKSKFDALMEEYYDISNTDELNDAKDARAAEVAQAKLARIEKIVDLDAESPEELLPSYVGKYIIQCPQCMTLFYKNQEDVEASEEDPNTVNISEVCQHCGNDAGYTLIGKVDQATQEETAEFNQEETVDVMSTEEGEQVDEEPAELDLDTELDTNLDALDLNLEDEPAVEEEPEEERKEESFTSGFGETVLVEELKEETELDISADDFETLISSPEFKKPISDSEARAMMNEFDDNNKNEVKEAIDINNETLRFAVINSDGTYAGVPCISEEEARELAAQKEGRVIVELGMLKEGIFDKLKDKFIDTLDSVAGKLKSREEKANWVLTNAMKDYNGIELDAQGQLKPDNTNQRFKTFVIIGYAGNDSKGNPITTAPDFDDKNLVIGNKGVQYKNSYEAADKIAKGWSMIQGNGPAFIYLAKDENDENAVFLCEYFKGTLKNDQLENYFKVVKDSLKGAKLTAKGGMDTSEEASLNLEGIKSSDLKFFATEIFNHFNKKYSIDIVDGYKIHIVGAKTDLTSEINKADKIKVNNMEAVAEKLDDGTYVYALRPKTTQLQDNLNTIMGDLEELQESALESFISSSLVESYGNVAGFKLTECTYINNNFNVSGTIYFTSGNARKTTYVFTEALTTKKGKINLRGINEKLGLDKQFIITGHTNNKTFITESFKLAKK
jgi:hypothetical protein